MTCEAYAKRYERLHPLIRKTLQSYFPKLDLNTVQIKIVTFIPYKLTIFALADAVVVKVGKLNTEFKQESFTKDGKLWHRSNGAVDLSIPVGIQILAHELKHCEQWRNTPRWRYWLGYLPGLFKSWASGQRYAHRFIKWEREAAAFQKTVRLTEQEHKSFKLLQ